ncbi:MAG: 4-hydroxyphenylpyruvate dioxygenase [Legionellaceae bacterium]|nr:4-hydroxyphenylpyruvate dioxygenase [Legionellaceae bacterium]
MMRENPCGLNGFAFLEFSGPSPTALSQQFHAMGFQEVARHTDADMIHFRQGDIDFIVNASSDSQASTHAKVHGAGACAMGFVVEDADKALSHALRNGAREFHEPSRTKHNLPAIEGIGGSVIYFVDARHSLFQEQWIPVATTTPKAQAEVGLVHIDHLTHNVYRGNMDKWADFYQAIFNFREIRFFNIKGQITGLVSRALASPCGKIKIPLNESKDDHSQIEEFLQEYHGEGIQHIALSTNTIINSVKKLRQNEVRFLDVPDTYYDMVDTRIPWHQEPLAQLQEQKILIDGEPDRSKGLLLQIFTENIFGPVFFEIIQRKGNDGFGEGNFQALFEAIERDQIRRGKLEVSE